MIDSIFFVKKFDNKLIFSSLYEDCRNVAIKDNIYKVFSTSDVLSRYEQEIFSQKGNKLFEKSILSFYKSSHQKFVMLFDFVSLKITVNINVNKFFFTNNIYNYSVNKVDYLDKGFFISSLKKEFDLLYKAFRLLYPRKIPVDLTKFDVERFDIGANYLFNNELEKKRYLHYLKTRPIAKSSQTNEYESSIYRASRKMTIKVYDKIAEYIKNTPIKERLKDFENLNILRYEFEFRTNYLKEIKAIRQFKVDYPAMYKDVITLRYQKSISHPNIELLTSNRLKWSNREYERYIKDKSKGYISFSHLTNYLSIVENLFFKYKRKFLLEDYETFTVDDFKNKYPKLSVNTFKKMLFIVKKNKGNVSVLFDFWGRSTVYRYKDALELSYAFSRKIRFNESEKFNILLKKFCILKK